MITTQQHCPASQAAPGSDNSTHHFIPRAGVMTCTMCHQPETADRPLRDIAAEVIAAWPKAIAKGQTFFGTHDYLHPAGPYLDAMRYLDGINDRFGADSARTVVVYFLENASGWRGPDARRIKAELQAMLASK